MEEIWGDCFVEENNLTQYIFTLRRVLGEKTSGEKFIETVPRRGYRFKAQVRVHEIQDLEIETPANQEIHTTTSGIHETLSEVFNGESETEKPSPPKHRIERLFAFGFIILIVVISLGFALHYGLQANSRELKFKRLTEEGNLFGAAISPDGNSLAYVSIEGKNQHTVRLRNILTESEIVVVPPVSGIIGSPVFSPDGNFIFYSQIAAGELGAVYQVPVFGGEPRRIAENLWSDFAVSPDGREIAFPRKDPSAKKHYIVLARTDGSGERIAAERSDPDYYALWGPEPVWSRDGGHLTVVAGIAGIHANYLVEINTGDKSERGINIDGEWDYIDAVGWAGKNELIMAARAKGEEKAQLWRISFPAGAVERLTNDFNDYVAFNLTRDASRLLALKQVENLHLWLFDAQTGAARQLTFGENRADGNYGLTFAPDGEIIFAARNKNERHLFSINPDGNDLRQLTKNAGRRNQNPVVSPDNRFIVFVSDRTGADRLWIMNRDGSDPRQLTAPSEDKQIQEFAPHFSPDGGWIFYSAFRGTSSSIYKISADGGEPAELFKPDQDTWMPAVSPDGNILAFTLHDPQAKQPWQIGVRSLADGKEKFFYTPAFRHISRWLPDSRSLVSIEQSFNGGNLWKTNIETGEREQITNFTAERLYHFDVSRDGRFFVVSRGNGFIDAVLIER
jgi:Tol biopolymer transport system component